MEIQKQIVNQTNGTSYWQINFIANSILPISLEDYNRINDEIQKKIDTLYEDLPESPQEKINRRSQY